MIRRCLTVLATAITLCAAGPKPALAADQAPVWSRHENPSDRAAIQAVIEKFRLAIIAKDGAAISKLLLNSRTIFNEIDDQAAIDKVRDFDPRFDGLGAPGFLAFSRYLAGEKAPIEERFKNIVVTQDGPLALVTFDYQFVSNGKVENQGVEHWMLRKVDGEWRIFSVVWTAT